MAVPPKKDSGLYTRVKKKSGRTENSRRWLERQINDPYVKKARRDGFRSRAAYKLIEIDERYKFIKSGQRILDLGAAPGGWTQILVDRVGVMEGRGFVLGLDILPMEPVVGAVLLELDFLSDDAEAIVEQHLGGKADGVVSDMAANTIGHKSTDHIRTMALVEAAAYSAFKWLAPGGYFLSKIFQGGTSPDLLALLKQHFTKVHHVKPQASRSESKEMYVLATGFKNNYVPLAEDDTHRHVV